VLETKGDGKGSPAEDVALAMKLRERGVKARKRRRAAGASGRRRLEPTPRGCSKR
jgi:hypothetical protein